ncbi:hypothetical protein GCM10027418_22580 [Mariniluteicoccus endophyticus]
MGAPLRPATDHPVRAPNLRYFALQAAYWALFAVALVFPSVFLLAHGLTNAMVGATMAAGGLTSVLLQPVVARAAARSRFPLRFWLGGLVVGAAAAAVALLLPSPGLVRAVLYALLLALVQAVLPLVNAVGMAATHAGVPVRYGPARGVGSASFAVVALGGGVLVAATGPGTVPLLALVACALLLVAALTFAVPTEDDTAALRIDTDPAAAADALDPAARLRFWALLVGLTGAYAAHSTITSFTFQLTSHHGGNASHLGLALALGAAAEVVPMLAFGLLLARWRAGTLLRVAAVMMLVKSLAALLAPNLTLFLATGLLQAVSFAVVVPASVYYVDQLFGPRDRVQGQAAAAVTMTVGNVVAALLGGAVLDLGGVPALLALSTGLGVVGAIATAVGTRPARGAYPGMAGNSRK